MHTLILYEKYTLLYNYVQKYYYYHDIVLNVQKFHSCSNCKEGRNGARVQSINWEAGVVKYLVEATIGLSTNFHIL